MDLSRSKADLIAENAFLRQQLIILKRQTKRPSLTPTDRGLLVFLASRIQRWREALLIVKPDTLLKRHRRAFDFSGDVSQNLNPDQHASRQKPSS